MGNADHAGVAAAELADDLGGFVGAAIVDEDDLVVDVELAEGVGQAPYMIGMAWTSL